MERVLRVDKLSKRFGRIQAVDRLELEIYAGQVFGILGPNGSGKTTTLGMILDVIAPSEGSFQWFEQEDRVAARKRMGSILEMPCFYPYLTAVQNLRITAHIKQCGGGNIDHVLRQVGLFDRRKDKYKTYSLGMKQRLSIGSALLSDPPVLIFDEPTNGLDPEGIAEVRELIRNITKAGKTIIMASHLLDEVQKVCTHFCVLRSGKKLHEGNVSDTLGELNKVEIAAGDMKKLKSVVNGFSGKIALRENGSTLSVVMKEGFGADDLNGYCFEKGITLKKLDTQRRSLEQEFLKILREND